MMTVLVIYCINNNKQSKIPVAMLTGFILDILIAMTIVNGLS